MLQTRHKKTLGLGRAGDSEHEPQGETNVSHISDPAICLIGAACFGLCIVIVIVMVLVYAHQDRPDVTSQPTLTDDTTCIERAARLAADLASEHYLSQVTHLLRDHLERR